MTRARLDAEELDLIEHAMIDLGKIFSIDPYPTETTKDNVANVTKVIQKINLVRKCSREDGIDISPAHGG